MRDLTIKITADTSQAEAGLKRTEQGLSGVEKAAGGVGKATEGVQLSLSSLAKAAGGYKAVEQSLGNIVAFSRGSLDAFADQELAVKKLVTALEASGQATPAIIGQYDALASSFERTTRFSDDLIQEMQALLVQVGGVGPPQMEAALRAATDLSAGLGVDLRTATMLVAKAFEGHTETLGRYGISVDKAKLEAQGITAVLDAINEKFGGQAQAQLETYAGRVDHLGNRWNNFQERVGDLIARALTPLLDLFDAMPERLQDVAFGIGTVTGLLAPLVGGVALLANAFGVSLIPLITGPLMAAWGGLTTFFTATLMPLIAVLIPKALAALAALFTVPAGLVVAGVLAVVAIWYKWDAIGPIVQKVYTAVKEWLVDKFAIVVNWIGEKVGMVTGFFKTMYDKTVGHSYVPDMITGVEVHFGRLQSVMVMPAQSAAQAVINVFQRMAGTVVQSLQPMFSGMQQSISQSLPSLFGGTGLFANIMNTGLTGIFGPGGLAATLVMKGLTALGDLAVKGLKKIWSGIKNLFGGPSGEELAGRELVADFEKELDGLLTDTQRLATGNEGWKNTVVAIRDRYLELGLTEAEALRDTERLWASSREGAEAAMRVIEEIRRKFEGGITIPVRMDLPEAVGNLDPQFGRVVDLPTFHDGGVVARRPVVTAGLSDDEVLVLAQRGEGVINRGGMDRLGASGLAALNQRHGAAAAPVPAVGDIHLYVSGYLDSPQSARHLAAVVRAEFDHDIQRRRLMSRG
jgi:hypothetical protein